MKNDIKWHEGCLKNRLVSLDIKRGNLVDLQKSVDEDARSYNLYLSQIRSAKEEGKAEFDRVEYGIRRLVLGKGD